MKRLGLQNPQMSLLHGGAELLLRDTELALHSFNNPLRKQVHKQNDMYDKVHSVLNTAMQLLHLRGKEKYPASPLTSYRRINY